ncbi:hypothetical protein [Octadecabacter sp. R77987]|uniref:hypothetical protein n=1 Tax=Octadecabacter sp. R77987 TaxID=3093874 RepID=UPI00367342E7
MSILSHTPPRPRADLRAVFNLPLIGQVARDLASGGTRIIWYALAIALLLLTAAIATWGLPALVITAVAAVPVCMIAIVFMAWG